MNTEIGYSTPEFSEAEKWQYQPVTIQITRELPTMDVMTMVEKASVQSKSMYDQASTELELGLVSEIWSLKVGVKFIMT